MELISIYREDLIMVGTIKYDNLPIIGLTGLAFMDNLNESNKSRGGANMLPTPFNRVRQYINDSELNTCPINGYDNKFNYIPAEGDLTAEGNGTYDEFRELGLLLGYLSK